jgi:glyoxylase-like metal-dependent hydrolase (beta-lactamase superfamily II)
MNMILSHTKNIKVIRVAIPTPTLWPHTSTNCYVIGNEQESILADAGYDQAVTKSELDKALNEHNLAQPKGIVLTHHHPDHAPGVRQLTEWSAPIYCHALEEQKMREVIGPNTNLSFLKDGDSLLVAGHKVEILHAPGHTAGHLNLYLPGEELLIAGDNLVAEGTTWIGRPDGDMALYMDSLRKAKQLKLAIVGPGHGEWIQQPYEHIDFVLNRRILREKQILSLLEEHDQLKVESLTKLIYDGSIHPSIFEVAKRTTEAHLEKLRDEGKVLFKDPLYALSQM